MGTEESSRAQRSPPPYAGAAAHRATHGARRADSQSSEAPGEWLRGSKLCPRDPHGSHSIYSAYRKRMGMGGCGTQLRIGVRAANGGLPNLQQNSISGNRNKPNFNQKQRAFLTATEIGSCNTLPQIPMGSQPSKIKAECLLQDQLLFPWEFPCGFLREMRPEEPAAAPPACQHPGLSRAGFPASRTDAHHRGLLFEEGGF